MNYPGLLSLAASLAFGFMWWVLGAGWLSLFATPLVESYMTWRGHGSRRLAEVVARAFLFAGTFAAIGYWMHLSG